MNIKCYIDRFDLRFPKGFNERQKRLDFFEKVLTGSIYDNMLPFYGEYTSEFESGKYIPLARRSPCVKYKLAKIIVNEIAAMLFGESHFPQLRIGDNKDSDTLKLMQKISRESNLRLVMINAAKCGSVGSVAVVVKYLDGKFAFEIIKTKYLTPKFDVFDNSVLTNLVEKKYIKGKDLIVLGYIVDKDQLNIDFCLTREWNTYAEIYYVPYTADEKDSYGFTPKIDNERTVYHNLGFVPVQWIKNPHSDDEDDIDGNCIFSDVIDIGIEIDYQLSQHGRLLKYNSDPTLVIKDPTRLENQELVKGIGALMVGQDGDAKYLQLESSATQAVLSYIEKLRQFAIEVVRGDRSNPDKLLSGHSGKALQMLNKPMISLVDEMRISYGEIGLLSIYRMIYRILTHEGIDSSSISYEIEKDCDGDFVLDWPQFYPSNEQDKLATANTLKTLVDSGNLSHKSAINILSGDYNITDVEKEIGEISKDQMSLQEKSPQIKETINA